MLPHGFAFMGSRGEPVPDGDTSPIYDDLGIATYKDQHARVRLTPDGHVELTDGFEFVALKPREMEDLISWWRNNGKPVDDA